MRKTGFCIGKHKDADKRAETAKLIRASVFAMQTVQSLDFLNPKFLASSHLLLLAQLCQTRSKILQTSFHVKRLNLQSNLSYTATQKNTKERIFKTDNHLMQVKSIAECSGGAFCNTLDPALSYHLFSRPQFYMFLSGRLIQV